MLMMHGQTNIKFVNAKQAKEIYSYKNTKKDCTKLLQLYGVTRPVETNNYRQTTLPSRLTAIIENTPIF